MRTEAELMKEIMYHQKCLDEAKARLRVVMFKDAPVVQEKPKKRGGWTWKRARMSRAQKKVWASMTAEQRQDRVNRVRISRGLLPTNGESLNGTILEVQNG